MSSITLVDIATAKIGTFNAFSFTLLIGFFFFVLIFVRSKNRTNKKFGAKTDKSIKKFLNRSAPFVKWTPLRLPLFDGLVTLAMVRMKGIRWLENWAKQFGSHFQLEIFNLNFFAHLDPAVIQKVLKSSAPAHLNKPRTLYSLGVTDLLKDGLIMSHADVWKQHRKALSPAFAYNTTLSHIQIIEHAANDLVTNARKQAKLLASGALGNKTMKTLINQATLVVITDLLMDSSKCGISKKELKQFYDNVHVWRNLSTIRLANPVLAFPPVWMLHPGKWKLDKQIESIREFFNQVIHTYRKIESTEMSDNMESGQKPFKCLIEHMIKFGLTNKEILDELCTFIVVGHETVEKTLDFLIFHLASHTEMQKICQEEIDRLINSKTATSVSLTLDDLSTLKYLERCILETLRITPTAPAFGRLLEENVELEDGSVIEAGRTFLALPWLLHRNPALYPDPENFDPDRFLPENVKQRHPYSFIPFSMGPRNCIGFKFALLEIKIMIKALLENFSFSTVDSIDDVKILFDVTLKTERDYNIKFQVRENGNFC